MSIDRCANGLVIKLRISGGDAKGAKSFLAAFEGAVVIRKLADTIEMRIHADDLHRIFAVLEKAKNENRIHNYSIAEMTLEEV